MISPEDKNRLQKAFRDAVEKSGRGDEPAGGGWNVTKREAVEQILADDGFYAAIDAAPAGTLDKIIFKLEKDTSRGPTP